MVTIKTAMEALLNPHANYNAASLVLAVANLIIVFVLWLWARDIMKERGMRCIDLFYDGPLRMIGGAIVLFFGIAFGSIMWLPAFPILLSGNVPLSDWYIKFATWPANIANMLSVVGMSMVLWSALQRKFGGFWTTITTVVGVTLVVYVFGIVGSLILGEWIRQWTT